MAVDNTLGQMSFQVRQDGNASQLTSHIAKGDQSHRRECGLSFKASGSK
jgi:hypothetical protein